MRADCGILGASLATVDGRVAAILSVLMQTVGSKLIDYADIMGSQSGIITFLADHIDCVN